MSAWEWVLGALCALALVVVLSAMFVGGDHDE